MSKQILAALVIMIAAPVLTLLVLHKIEPWTATATGLWLQILIQSRNLS